MHRRRGGEARKRGTGGLGGDAPGRSVSEPRPPVSAAWPFLLEDAPPPTEGPSTSPVISRSPLGFGMNPGPYVSGTLGASDRNNHAYGISCRTRPIPISSTRARHVRNRYRMGRFLRRPPP